MIDLHQLIPQAHAAARAKGFWPEDAEPNAAQFLMLTIGELGECQEAHRKGRVGDMANYIAGTAELCKNPTYAAFQPATFARLVKDSVGDELADAYIRLCDFAAGFDEDLAELCTWAEGIRRHGFAPAANFGEALLEITSYVLDARTANGRAPHRTKGLAGALVRIEALAAREGIDLAQHIELKLAYNETRPVRHGKAY